MNDLHVVYLGATVCTEQLPVLTANKSHFERIDGVRVVDWTGYWRTPVGRSPYDDRINASYHSRFSRYHSTNFVTPSRIPVVGS